jgi:hypothetical protein
MRGASSTRETMHGFPSNAVDWRGLPELPIAALAQRGRVLYEVQRVAVVLVPVSMCHEADIYDAPVEEGARVALPIANLQGDSLDSFFRLPLQLCGWALDVVALALIARVQLLPDTVEFHVTNGRYFAGTVRRETRVRSWFQRPAAECMPTTTADTSS